jgi:hypothetical protein
MKKIFAFTVAILPFFGLYAQLPDAASIIDAGRDATATGQLSSRITLSITEKNGSERKRTVQMISKTSNDGTEKRLIRFLEPAEVKGTSILIYDYSSKSDEMWIWLPALKKTRRLASSDKGKSFMSSEFSNSDMSSPDRADFTYRHLQGSGENGQYLIECTPVNEKIVSDYGFSRKVTILSVSGYRLMRNEYYDLNNKLFRIIEVQSTKELQGGKYTVTAMTAKNLMNGRKSEFKTENISTAGTTDDALFTVSSLEQQ